MGSLIASQVSALLLATTLIGPALAEAVLVRQGAQEIIGEPGIVPSLFIILFSLLALYFVPAGDPIDLHISDGWGPWAGLIAYIAVLYATIPVGFQAVSGIVQRIGSWNFMAAVNLFGAVVAAALTLYLVSRHRTDRPMAYIWFLGIALVFLYYFWMLEVTVKRIHFLEYAALAVLMYRAFRARVAPPTLYPVVALSVAGVGAGDETIALFLPKRFGAVTDVIFDVTGGLLGLMLIKFVLRKG